MPIGLVLWRRAYLSGERPEKHPEHLERGRYADREFAARNKNLQLLSEEAALLGIYC
jgi:hypothetical protein